MDSFILNRDIYKIPHGKFKNNLNELVELFQIKDILNIQVRKLSLGQRMKCELVAALLHSPKVIFLDEPTIGLDVVAQKNIRDFIKKYNELHKTTIILTSHYMEDIKGLCKRIIIINKVSIIYDDQLKNLLNDFVQYKEIVVTFNQPGIRRQEINNYGEIKEFNPYKTTILVENENSKKIASQILSSSLPVDDILINEISVDDVIREIFNKNKT
jgi:ABC-2 type transport system ATP-binding protein